MKSPGLVALLCLPFLCCLFFTSCRDNDDLVFPHPSLLLNKSSLDFGTANDYGEILVSSPTEGGFEFTATTDKSWLGFRDDKNVVYQTWRGHCTNAEAASLPIYVDKTGLSPGKYTGIVSVQSNFGSQQISVALEILSDAFIAKFNNTIFTPITITISGVTKTIQPNTSVTYYFSTKPSSFYYYAKTSGTTTSGAVIGKIVEWSYTVTPGIDPSIERNLGTYEYIFFLYMKNTGIHVFNPIYVNYGNSYQTVDNIIIPNDGITYRTGYYLNPGSSTTCQVRATWQDNTNFYTYWNMVIPYLVNTFVVLSATSSASILSAEKSTEEYYTPSFNAVGYLIPETVALNQPSNFHGEKALAKFADSASSDKHDTIKINNVEVK